MGKRKSFKVAAGLAVFLLLTGCLKTPDLEYVVNKESQGNYVYEENSDFGSLKEQLGIPEHVTESFSSEDGMVTGKINADVAVPTEGVVPVYSVVPVEWSEEQMERFVTSFYDGEFYRYPYVRNDSVSKEDYQHLISDWEEHLANCTIADENATLGKKGDSYVDEFGNEIIGMVSEERYREMQSIISNYYEEMEKAPSQAELCQPPTYDLESYTDQTKIWDASIGDFSLADYTYHAAEYLGEKNGNKAFLQIQQDDQISLLWFQLDENIELKCGYSCQDFRLHGDKNVTANDGIMNSCSYTAEEAKELCRNQLREMGLTDLDVRAVHHLKIRNETRGPVEYRGYRIYCYRTYGEMGDTLYHGDGSYFDDENYSKCSTIETCIYYDEEEQIFRHFDGCDREMAVFTVLDEGIVEAVIMNPRKNQACLAENTKLLDFDTVLQQGIAQMSVQYAPAGERQGRKGLTINAIELNYACMKNPNAEKEYTMIPVWDFKSGWSGQTYITINAVDGTVFNRKTGY